MKKSDAQKKRIHFTWAYAHPDLTDISTGNPGSIEGGALRASANISELEKLPIYDLYALGKTIQQIQAVVDLHFGEVCYSSYSFRYLHILLHFFWVAATVSKEHSKHVFTEWDQGCHSVPHGFKRHFAGGEKDSVSSGIGSAAETVQ